MKGDADVLEALNAILTAELTAIHQYHVHHKMCARWGYERLSDTKSAAAKGAMRGADKLIERILSLGGVPNMQRLDPVRIGEDPLDMHRVDLKLRVAACAHLNEAIELSRGREDNGTRRLLEELLGDEECSVDWLEAQLEVARTIGAKHYLAQQLHRD